MNKERVAGKKGSDMTALVFYCIINTGIIGNQHAIRNGKRAISYTYLRSRHFSIHPNERGE